MQTFSKGGNITCSISDHFLQFCQIDIFDTTNPNHAKKIGFSRNCRIFNKREFEEELSNVDLSEINNANSNSNHSFSNFFKQIEKLLDETAPVRKLSKKEMGLKEIPWITNGILISMKERDSLYKEFTNEKDPIKRNEVHARYKKHRNLILTLTRTSKNNTSLNISKNTNLT